MLDAALDYATRGWRVHPLRSGEKVPRLRDWPNRATTDAEQIRAWWKIKHHNVGIATGGGLVVLDVDPRNGGETTLRHMLKLAKHELPVTPEVHTAGGGRHFYFAARHGQPSGKLAPEMGPGLDFQADGRQVVAPPSLGPGGRQYTWHPERGPDTPLAPLPAWLGKRVDWAGERETAKPDLPDPDGPGSFVESIAPPDYVRDLAGLEVGPDGGKVGCPFHFDRTPSLHVYPTAKRGWYCYGCERGGNIFQFAALVGGFSLPLRGADFLRVESALLDIYSQRLGVSSP
jgi:hypothetical protein